MSKEIIRTPRAVADILAIHDYIDNDNPTAAARFLDETEACFEQLAMMPGSGRLYESLNSRLRDVRVYPIPHFRNYLAFYRVQPDEILILTVLHGARDLDPLLEDFDE